jgi:D-alanine-D-alanine ligase
MLRSAEIAALPVTCVGPVKGSKTCYFAETKSFFGDFRKNLMTSCKYEFYDFAAKYLDDATTLTIPADIDPEMSREIQAMAQEAFIALGCEGLARVDFFLTAEGLLINEVNTMPGFTPTSMYPRLWDASGVPYKELISILIDEALARPTTILR